VTPEIQAVSGWTLTSIQAREATMVVNLLEDTLRTPLRAEGFSPRLEA
jgi:hypothetical protein